MLKITVPGGEAFNEETNEFYVSKETTIQLEHSLLSISKWEAKWKKPFLSKKAGDKTTEEVLDYIRCMTLTQNVDPMLYYFLSAENYEAINSYIEDAACATKFYGVESKKNGETITAESIYYWMITLGIPFECQKWHLNKLLALIELASIKNSPSKKMTKKDLYAQNRSINEARKRALKSRG